MYTTCLSYIYRYLPPQLKEKGRRAVNLSRYGDLGESWCTLLITFSVESRKVPLHTANTTSAHGKPNRLREADR